MRDESIAIRRMLKNPAYEQVERILLQLHDLRMEGKDDGAEAEQLWEEMEYYLEKLPPEATTFLEGLSADLYQISGEEILAKPSPSLDPAAFLQSVHDNDWAASLVLARFEAVRDMLNWGNKEVAIHRANAWQQLGREELSLRFLEYAFTCDAEDEKIGTLLLLRLADHDLEKAIDFYRTIPSDHIAKRLEPFAFHIECRRCAMLSENDRSSRSLELYERFQRLRQAPGTLQDIPQMRALCFASGATIAVDLGLHDEARQILTEAFSSDPNSGLIKRMYALYLLVSDVIEDQELGKRLADELLQQHEADWALCMELAIRTLGKGDLQGALWYCESGLDYCGEYSEYGEKRYLLLCYKAIVLTEMALQDPTAASWLFDEAEKLFVAAKYPSMYLDVVLKNWAVFAECRDKPDAAREWFMIKIPFIESVPSMSTVAA